MSYSRWSNSNWYAFYNCIGDTLDKDDQVLSLWYAGDETLPNFTYDYLVDIADDETTLASHYNCEISATDLVEAMVYINEFISDVNEEFDCDKK